MATKLTGNAAVCWALTQRGEAQVMRKTDAYDVYTRTYYPKRDAKGRLVVAARQKYYLVKIGGRSLRISSDGTVKRSINALPGERDLLIAEGQKK
jgi:hypothetical protein